MAGRGSASTPGRGRRITTADGASDATPGIWIPGRTWGAAWVSWAAAADYVSWCPLGFDGRPVIGVSIIGSERWAYRDHGWNGWTVVPRAHFGARGAYAHRYAVEPRRLPSNTPFIAQSRPPVGLPHQSAVGSHQSSVASSVVSRQSQSSVGSRQSSVGSRQSSVGSRQRRGSRQSSRQSSVVSRQSSVGSRQSAVNSRQSVGRRRQPSVGGSSHLPAVSGSPAAGCGGCSIPRRYRPTDPRPPANGSRATATDHRSTDQRPTDQRPTDRRQDDSERLRRSPPCLSDRDAAGPGDTTAHCA